MENLAATTPLPRAEHHPHSGPVFQAETSGSERPRFPAPQGVFTLDQGSLDLDKLSQDAFFVHSTDGSQHNEQPSLKHDLQWERTASG